MSNSGRTVIQAVDMQFNWPMRGMAGGVIEPYASVTWLPSIRRRSAPDAPWIQRVGHRDNPLRWRGNGGVRWRRWPVNVDLNLQYYDSYRISPAVGADSSGEQTLLRFQGSDRIPAQLYVDLAAGWSFELNGGDPVRTLTCASASRTCSITARRSSPTQRAPVSVPLTTRGGGASSWRSRFGIERFHSALARSATPAPRLLHINLQQLA